MKFTFKAPQKGHRSGKCLIILKPHTLHTYCSFSNKFLKPKKTNSSKNKKIKIFNSLNQLFYKIYQSILIYNL